MAFEDLDEHMAELFGDVRHDRTLDGVTLLQPFLPDRLKRTPEGYARKQFVKHMARAAAREQAKLCACGCGRPLILPKRKRGGSRKRYLGECAQRINTAQKRASRNRKLLQFTTPDSRHGGSMETQGIGWAVKQMQDGQRVRRSGWNGKGMWIALQRPDAHSKMTEPYVFMKTAQDGLIPWLCSQADLLASDWELADAVTSGTDASDGRKTMYVRTDGGIGKLAARHGIDLVVVPEDTRPPQPSHDHQWDDVAKKWVVPGPHTGPAINHSGVGD